MRKQYIILLIFLLEIYFLAGSWALTTKPLKTKSGEVYVIEDAPLFEGPLTNSKAIWEVPCFRIVKILSNVGDEWFYVDTYYPIPYEVRKTEKPTEFPTYRGWLRRKNLAGDIDFKRIKQFPSLFMKVSEAEEGYSLRTYSNGLFLYVQTTLRLGKETLSWSKQGYIYQCVLNPSLFLFEGIEAFIFSEEGIEILSPFVCGVEVFTNIPNFPAWARDEIPPLLVDQTKGENINVRENPSTNAPVLAKLNKERKVTILDWAEEVIEIGDKQGTWVYVDTGIVDNNKKPIRGWIFDAYLSYKQPDMSHYFEYYFILDTENVNLRAKPSTNSQVLLRLRKGAKVKVLEWSDKTLTIGDRSGSWVYVDTGIKDKSGNTIKGWIVDIYLDEEE
ncbi:SH3 domain-containing protein [Thermospira aquatica]|uniref:SH3 domain-containing protein n=1 Tax=Thermospira aquatica TaxID=2828656 RepID=A0AAX3BA61_9SPIR|nr:SH3 domain-containing protein [Thermospira aquatica]URA09141.1 SH3 domain-containing protein [Thermospira aquatica]